MSWKPNPPPPTLHTIRYFLSISVPKSGPISAQYLQISSDIGSVLLISRLLSAQYLQISANIGADVGGYDQYIFYGSSPDISPMSQRCIKHPIVTISVLFPNTSTEIKIS